MDTLSESLSDLGPTGDDLTVEQPPLERGPPLEEKPPLEGGPPSLKVGPPLGPPVDPADITGVDLANLREDANALIGNRGLLGKIKGNLAHVGDGPTRSGLIERLEAGLASSKRAATILLAYVSLVHGGAVAQGIKPGKLQPPPQAKKEKLEIKDKKPEAKPEKPAQLDTTPPPKPEIEKSLEAFKAQLKANGMEKFYEDNLKHLEKNNVPLETAAKYLSAYAEREGARVMGSADLKYAAEAIVHFKKAGITPESLVRFDQRFDWSRIDTIAQVFLFPKQTLWPEGTPTEKKNFRGECF